MKRGSLDQSEFRRLSRISFIFLLLNVSIRVVSAAVHRRLTLALAAHKAPSEASKDYCCASPVADAECANVLAFLVDLESSNATPARNSRSRFRAPSASGFATRRVTRIIFACNLESKDL